MALLMLYSYSKVTVSLFNGTVIFSALTGDRTGVSPMIGKNVSKKWHYSCYIVILTLERSKRVGRFAPPPDRSQ